MDGPIITDRPPPPVRVEAGGGGGGWAQLCTATDLYEAEIIRGLLAEHDISRVMVEAVPMIGSWMLPSGYERAPQRVLVLRIELERARLVLLEAGAAAPEPDPEESRQTMERRSRGAERLLRFAVGLAVAAVLVRALFALLGGDGG